MTKLWSLGCVNTTLPRACVKALIGEGDAYESKETQENRYIGGGLDGHNSTIVSLCSSNPPRDARASLVFGVNFPRPSGFQWERSQVSLPSGGHFFLSTDV